MAYSIVGIVSLRALHLFCVIAGAVGVAVLLARTATRVQVERT